LWVVGCGLWVGRLRSDLGGWIEFEARIVFLCLDERSGKLGVRRSLRGHCENISGKAANRYVCVFDVSLNAQRLEQRLGHSGRPLRRRGRGLVARRGGSRRYQSK